MPSSPPHDIYTLVPPQFPWTTVAVIIAIVIVLGVLSYFYWRYRRPTVVTQKLVTPPDLVRITRAKIIRLRPPDPFPIGTVQENYFFALSIALRELLEYRCRLPLIGATLPEVRPQLRKLPLARQTQENIEKFLQRADAVKFAAQPSDLSQARQDHQQVIKWVQQLTAAEDRVS